MKAMTAKDTIKTHYIDGAFVESHGLEVMDIVRPTDGQVIARVTLGDEEDTRRAIGAAKRAFASFGRTTKEERASILTPAASVCFSADRRSHCRHGGGVRRCCAVRQAYRGIRSQCLSGR